MLIRQANVDMYMAFESGLHIIIILHNASLYILKRNTYHWLE
jgi:hypothetical protein